MVLLLPNQRMGAEEWKSRGADLKENVFFLMRALKKDHVNSAFVRVGEEHQVFRLGFHK